MNKLISTLILSAALAACGGKQQQSTTPSNSTDASKGSGAMGGKTYGGASTATPAPSTGDTPPADPCAAP